MSTVSGLGAWSAGTVRRRPRSEYSIAASLRQQQLEHGQLGGLPRPATHSGA
ncbi:hypothetical protein [Cupriavidus sp. YAF13]|uniref:hypothetical protein n=1 Tax=Cupriavidus sp. YAF13 TaxID=3233075 RepID=UPI003F934712